MRFLSPGFLFALLAIAIPIIIHLFNFRKFKKVYFSNVRLLKNIQIQTSSRQHLKNRLILLSRILAISFLVLGFARPYIPSSAGNATYNLNAVSVFIDNSYSMETVNQEGTLLDEAKRRAREIAAAYNINDKFQLLSNDFEGKDQRLLSQQEFLKSLDEIEISSANRQLKSILERQAEVFRGQPNASKTVYIISDFQNQILGDEPALKDTSMQIRLVKVRATPQANISIDSAWFLSAVHRPGDTEQLVVRLKNNSDEKAENIPLRLKVNDQQKALGSLTLEARASKNDTLSFSGLSAGWQQAELEITDFPIVFDDKFYFSFKIHNKLPVLIINGKGINKYLDAVYRSDSYFEIANADPGNINYSGISAYPLVILNELNDISEGLQQQLTAYVEGGGTLMILPELADDLDDLRSLLQTLKADLPIALVTNETRVSAINLQHPIFKGVFDNIPQKIDLPLIKKYMQYSSSNTNRQTIMDLPGRQNFISEYRLGNGKVYLSAVPLTDESSNFARHSVFVPFMYQASLLSLQAQELFHTLNHDQVVEVPKITLGIGQSLTLKQGEFEAIPDLRQNENASQIYIADQIRQPGNYELFRGDSLISVLSFNDSGAESDLSYATEREVKQIVPGGNVEMITAGNNSLQNEISTTNLGTPLWRVFVILALICLAIEVLLIRYFNALNRRSTPYAN